MRYIITADASKWPETRFPKKALPYNEYAGCIGGLKIMFSIQDQNRIYKNATVNIPLFLTEFYCFLSRVDSDFPRDWYLGFAPFAYGLLLDGSLLISSKTGKAFSDGVYDATTPDDLARLKARVAKDIAKFGRVLMRPGTR